MDYLISRITDFVLSLDSFVRFSLVGLFAIFGILCLIKVVKIHYNSPKSKIKIAPIIFAVIFLLISWFIASV